MSEGRREKGWMKVDGLFGAICIFLYDVVLFSVHLSALRIVEPFRAEGGELCELAPRLLTSLDPRLDVCEFAKSGLTAPWLGFMKPDCIGTRMATCVFHVTVFVLFHAFCVGTDAHSVAAAATAGSLERRRLRRFALGAIAATVLYL